MEVDYSIGACEVLKDFKVSDLDIVDDKEVLFIKYPNKRSKDVLYKNINNLLKDLESVNSKGFVNELDISKYPIISDLAVSFTKHPKYLKGKEIFETYKWVFNILVLNLYFITVQVESDFFKEEADSESDLRSDFAVLSRNLYGKLDPSIRQKLQKRGISLIQNIYTGFDTEYKNINVKYNKLLSVQLAVNTNTLIKIPFKKDYTVCEINPLTNEEYGYYNRDEENFNYFKVENCINLMINKIRTLKLANNDSSIDLLREGLINLKIPCIRKKGFVVFKFPRTPIKQYIYVNSNDNDKGFTFDNMVNQSNSLGVPSLLNSYDKILDILRSIHKSASFTEVDEDNVSKVSLIASTNETDNKFIESKDLPVLSESLDVKKRTRYYLSSFSDDRISVTRIRNNYFIAHLTNADLSMMDDFEDFKGELDIVNKSFVTLGKPIVVGGSNIIIRDTMLLAPAANKSLEAIGAMYGEAFRKIEMKKDVMNNMDVLLAENHDLFIDYALKDALITLVHANNMEDFYFSLGEVGIPITLSGLSRKYVKIEWDKLGYKGYQVSKKFLLGDTSSFSTPKGLIGNLEPGLKMNYYIGNYKGGRNESFMYGADLNTNWFDYDLIGAYPTVMAACGNPDYAKGVVLDVLGLSSMSDKELIYSYIIIKCSFKFKETVKYPSIPCYLDETTTVYPLEGNGLLTGAEYVLAKKQGCKFQISEIYYIPFEKKRGKLVNKPFETVVKNLVLRRSEHPKGSLHNNLFKQINNSIYGLIVKGINEKRKYDLKSGKTVRMEAGEFSNPIIGSWITAFVRSIIGECLHSVQLNNGKVVSVTTDGFITNLSDLESLLKDNLLITEFRKMRFNLSGNSEGLELKHSGKGIISWTTRGQLSKEANLKASTGFQSRNYTLDELETMFLNVLSKNDKSLEYIQFSLRSAKDIFKKGGHVTPVYKDQVFRLHYDNRRLIQIPNNFNEQNFDLSQILLDSLPVKSVEESGNLRSISKIHKSKLYNRETSGLSGNTYKDYTDLAIRNFIKGLLSEPRLYNLDDSLKTYSDIIEFINGYKKSKKITKSSISHLKNRKMVFKSVPHTKETLEFVKYVKTKYKNFDEKSFLV